MLSSVILSTFFLHLNGRREEGSWLTGTSVSLSGQWGCSERIHRKGFFEDAFPNHSQEKHFLLYFFTGDLQSCALLVELGHRCHGSLLSRKPSCLWSFTGLTFLHKVPNNYHVGFYPFDEMSICYLPKGKVGLNHLKEKEEGLISFGTSFGGAGLGGLPLVVLCGNSQQKQWEVWTPLLSFVGGESWEGNVPRRIIPCLLCGVPRERGWVMKAWVFPTSSGLCNLLPSPPTCRRTLWTYLWNFHSNKSVNFPKLKSTAITGFAGSEHFRARTDFWLYEV